MKPQNHRSHRNRRQAPASLLPVSVVALGAPAEPVERLISLQAGFSKFVHMLTSLRRPRRSPPLCAATARRALEI
jgi:hypothetical protein